MNALLRPTIHSLWLCGTRAPGGRVGSSTPGVLAGVRVQPQRRLVALATRTHE